MDSLVIQDPSDWRSQSKGDPISYAPLPSAPPVDTVVTINPVPLTIRFISAHTASPATVANRQWLCYCIFIIFVFIFAVGTSYYILFSKHKN
jgi:hypothetical protein